MEVSGHTSWGRQELVGGLVMVGGLVSGAATINADHRTALSCIMIVPSIGVLCNVVRERQAIWTHSV